MFEAEKGIRAGKLLSNSVTAQIIALICVVVLIGGLSVDWLAFFSLGLALIILALFFNAIIIVPTVFFGAVTRFKKRIKKDGKLVPLDEGLSFVLPLADDLLPENLKSKKLTTEPVVSKALSLDKLEITIEGSVQYRPENLDIFISMTAEAIEKGMVDAIESELGNVSGVKNADTFVSERAEIELLIQCVLQLEKPPHHYIDDVGDEKAMGVVLKTTAIEKLRGEGAPESLIEEWKEKLLPQNWFLGGETLGFISKDQVFDITLFYKNNISRIAILFDIEEKLGAESKVERLYGISVATFRLSKLSFSEDAQKAFEKMRSATAEMDAANRRFTTKVDLLKKYINAGLTPVQAVNMVETTTEVKGVNRQIISVEGSQSADLLALAHLLGGAKGGKNE